MVLGTAPTRHHDMTEGRTVEDLIDDILDVGPADSATPEGRHWAALHNLFVHNEVPAEDVVKNLGMWHPATYVARLVTFAELWQRYILQSEGSIVQFGVRYGQDFVWFTQLRGLYEPYAYRSIIGFDTFEGHQGHTDVDGSDWMAQDGAFAVPDKFDEYLAALSWVHANASRPAVRNTAMPLVLVKGDVRKTLPEQLDGELRSLVAAAVFFDLDIYEPTAAALEAILPHCHANTLLVFDELDSNRMPGETQAVLDTVGLGGLALERNQWASMSWATLGTRR